MKIKAGYMAVLATLAISTSSHAEQSNNMDFKPFYNNHDITDVYWNYINFNYMESDYSKHYEINLSKNINKFMFAQIGWSYNTNDKFTYTDEQSNDGNDLSLTLGLKYPLPIPVDVAVADLYVSGTYEKRSYDDYLAFDSLDSINDDDAEYIEKNYNPQYLNSESIITIAGIKTNLGSSRMMLDIYGGLETTKPKDKVLKAISDEGFVESAYVTYGVTGSYFLTKGFAIDLLAKYKYDEVRFGVGFTTYFM